MDLDKELEAKKLVRIIRNRSSSKAEKNDAFESLMKLYEREIGRIVSNLYDKALRDDLLQEILKRVHKYLRGYNLERPFLHWVLKLARNQFISVATKEQNSKLQYGDLAEPEWSESDDSLDPKQLNRVIDETLKRCHMRRSVQYFNLERAGHSRREIAQKFGVSEKTVQSGIGAVRTWLYLVLGKKQEPYSKMFEKESLDEV